MHLPNLWNRIEKMLGIKGTPSAEDVLPTYGGVSGFNSPFKRQDTLAVLRSYGEVPWVFGPFSTVANDFASITWTMFRPPAGQKLRGSTRHKSVGQLLRRKDLVEVDHLLLEVLEQGNAFIDGYTCLQVMALTYLLDGEMCAVFERDAEGDIVAMYPIPTYWVVGLATPGRPFFSITFPGKTMDVPMEDVLWVVNPNPAEPFGRGVGLAQALLGDLEADDYAKKHVQNYFRNNSTPSLLIGVENATQEQLDRAKLLWEQDNRGLLQGFGTHFYSGKLTAQQLSRTFRENQTLDLRLFNRNTVMQTIGMPPEIQGIIENSNRSTIDAAMEIYGKKVLRPMAMKFKAAGQKLVSREYFRSYIFSYYEDFIPEDKEHTMSVFRAAPQVFTINEWRAQAGLGPIPGGEELYVPITYTSGLDEDEEDNDDEGASSSRDDNDESEDDDE